MSWVFMLSIVVLLAAILLIEYRAVRAGDERRHHAPGYMLVLGGLVMISIGIAAASSEQVAVALLASCAGLGAVVIGAARGTEATAH
jgi:hypothetical protein